MTCLNDLEIPLLFSNAKLMFIFKLSLNTKRKKNQTLKIKLYNQKP